MFLDYSPCSVLLYCTFSSCLAPHCRIAFRPTPPWSGRVGRGRMLFEARRRDVCERANQRALGSESLFGISDGV